MANRVVARVHGNTGKWKLGPADPGNRAVNPEVCWCVEKERQRQRQSCVRREGGEEGNKGIKTSKYICMCVCASVLYIATYT